MDKIKYSSELRKAFELVGSIGGKAAAANMTPEQRRERAIKGGKASGIARAKKKADREAQP